MIITYKYAADKIGERAKCFYEYSIAWAIYSSAQIVTTAEA